MEAAGGKTWPGECGGVQWDWSEAGGTRGGDYSEKEEKG